MYVVTMICATCTSPELTLDRHLGKDEMHTITGDKWDEKVWGAATSPGTDRFDTAQRNLFFYWGKKVSSLPHTP